MKKALIGTVLLLAVALVSTTARATTTSINLGGALSTGSVDFYASGGGSNVGVCLSGGCAITNTNAAISSISNGATIYNVTYTITNGNSILALIGSGPNFSIVSGGVITLSITDTVGGGGTAALALTLHSVKDSSLVPDFVGTYSVTSSTGNLTALLSGSNATGTFDYALDLPGPCTLDGIAARSCGPTTGTMSVLETVAPVPEPSSLLLFGSVLLSLGGILRRRLLGS
jgi:hypothetical protein